MQLLSSILFLSSILVFPTITSAWTPVVLWHGMGGFCCDPVLMGRFIRAIRQEMPGVYVKSLMFGNDVVEDSLSTIFGRMDDLVEDACQSIAGDANLRNGYHAIGVSQGGLGMRAVAQRCPTPGMKVLITWAGPHQGLYGVPETCHPWLPGGRVICNSIRWILTNGAYTDLAQRTIVTAQYWHDPTREEVYLQQSAFLADINNEREGAKNETYVENLTRLEKLILVTNAQDGMVIPRESCSFGYYKPGQVKEVLPMRKTRLYLEDWIGLRKLDQTGRVLEYTVPGEHAFINTEWFKKELIRKYLKK